MTDNSCMCVVSCLYITSTNNVHLYRISSSLYTNSHGSIHKQTSTRSIHKNYHNCVARHVHIHTHTLLYIYTGEYMSVVVIFDVSNNCYLHNTHILGTTFHCVSCGVVSYINKHKICYYFTKCERLN